MISRKNSKKTVQGFPRRHFRIEGLESRVLLSNVYFPPDSGIINVTTIYGADNTGATDDTLALQRAISDNVGLNHTLYFPNGTYLVSRPLDYRHNDITYTLSAAATVSSVNIAWGAGNTKKYYFDVDVSTDGTNFTRVYRGNSSGTTTSFETYSFTPQANVKKVKITGLGTSTFDYNMSIAETQIPGATIASVVGTGSGAANTIDGNLSTLWTVTDAGSMSDRLTLQGQSQSGTIIKLANSAAGYTNPSVHAAVIQTENASNAGNTAFWNSIDDLTVNTGTGNPGANGIDYEVSNEGAIRDVTIQSGDPSFVGNYGLYCQGSPGPGLVKNLTVSGFGTGVYLDAGKYSMTFENITLSHQSQIAFNSVGNTCSVENLTVSQIPSNVVAANVQSTGLLTLVGANISYTGGTPAAAAIVYSGNTSTLYARSVTLSGSNLPPAIANGTTVKVAGASVTEYASQSASLFPSPNTMLNLPHPDFTPFNDTNPADWVNAGNPSSFGSNVPAPVAGDGKDDSPAIQAAIDYAAAHNLTTVYLPAGNHVNYEIGQTIHIHGSVQVIEGMDNSFIAIGPYFGDPTTPKAMFSVDGGAGSPSQVMLDRMNILIGSDFAEPAQNTISVQNSLSSSQTLVVRDGVMSTYRNSAGAGPLYLEDVVGSNWVFSNEQVWGRQLDPESYMTKITNTGPNGQLWILGLKTEMATSAIVTTGGAKTELLGAFIFQNSGNRVTPTFSSTDSQMSLVFKTYNYNAATSSFSELVEQTQSGVTRDLYAWDFSAGMFTGISGTAAPLPIVNITNLTNGQVFAANSNISINVSASESGGSIASTSIYSIMGLGVTGGTTAATLLGTGASATLANAAPGVYRIYAKSIDANGVAGYSPTYKITVEPPADPSHAPTGSILREYYEWDDQLATLAPSSQPQALEDDPRYANPVTNLAASPSLWDYPTTFSTDNSITSGQHGSYGRDYGILMRGWITPPTSGNYIFYITGGNSSVLRLSTDSDPLNKRPIAWIVSSAAAPAYQGWTTANQSNEASASIALVGGQSYYIEAEEQVGQNDGAHMEVGWSSNGGAAISMIPGSVLAPWDNTSAKPVKQLPAGVTAVYPNGDTYVRNGGTAGQDMGDLATLLTGGGQSRSLLKFNLSSYNSATTSAVLTLYPTSASSPGPNLLALISDPTTWNERTSNWNNWTNWTNVPPDGTQIGSSWTPVAGTPVTIDVTAAVNAAIAAHQTEISFELYSTSTSGSTNYGSRETFFEQRPLLTVTGGIASGVTEDFSSYALGSTLSNGSTIAGGKVTVNYRTYSDGSGQNSLASIVTGISGNSLDLMSDRSSAGAVANGDAYLQENSALQVPASGTDVRSLDFNLRSVGNKSILQNLNFGFFDATGAYPYNNQTSAQLGIALALVGNLDGSGNLLSASGYLTRMNNTTGKMEYYTGSSWTTTATALVTLSPKTTYHLEIDTTSTNFTFILSQGGTTVFNVSSLITDVKQPNGLKLLIGDTTISSGGAANELWLDNLIFDLA